MGQNGRIMYSDERTSRYCQGDYASIIISDKKISINLLGETFSHKSYQCFVRSVSQYKKKKKKQAKRNKGDLTKLVSKETINEIK